MEDFKLEKLEDKYKLVMFAKYCTICNKEQPVNLEICPDCKRRLFGLAHPVKKEA
jgi:hypothetical protein